MPSSIKNVEKDLSLGRVPLLVLEESDGEIHKAISREVYRLQNSIELIASENVVSLAVLEAQGSVMTNKYAEGYPGRRYYGGCENIDEIERLAIERAKALFSCEFANVQAHSGSQANQAAYLAVMQPGDTLLGMSLSSGGHLTHGALPNQSGKWFKPVQYGVREDNAIIDYEEVAQLAILHCPKVIVCGGSAYSRIIDFARFRKIADSVDATLIVDMAHFSGLIAAGIYPNPFPYAHIVTSTTHKTLRGPRGGLILSNDAAIGKKIDSAIFPGLQGGPLGHVIAAKAVAFGEALNPNFKLYAEQVVLNAKMLADTLSAQDIDIVSGGTDTHLLLADLRRKNVTGKEVEESLERAGITCNKNAIPFDSEKPSVTSGIRLGSPAATSRGFGLEEFKQIGIWIAKVIDSLCESRVSNKSMEAQVFEEVKRLCSRFPIYPNLT